MDPHRHSYSCPSKEIPRYILSSLRQTLQTSLCAIGHPYEHLYRQQDIFISIPISNRRSEYASVKVSYERSYGRHFRHPYRQWGISHSHPYLHIREHQDILISRKGFYQASISIVVSNTTSSIGTNINVPMGNWVSLYAPLYEFL